MVAAMTCILGVSSRPDSQSPYDSRTVYVQKVEVCNVYLRIMAAARQALSVTFRFRGVVNHLRVLWSKVQKTPEVLANLISLGWQENQMECQ